MRDDEAALTADIIAFATEYGRYGYRRIAAMLRDAGWVVNVKRIERIWRREGLKVPQKLLRDELLNGESFTRCKRPRSSSRVGDDTTTAFVPTLRSATDHLHRSSSCPRVRLRNLGQLRRTRSCWHRAQP
jgi:transposase InsO family protein